MACKGCKNFFQSWGLLFDDEMHHGGGADAHTPSQFPGTKKDDGTAEQPAVANAVKPTVERCGARLITHHRHRSECAQSEGNRFITDDQL